MDRFDGYILAIPAFYIFIRDINDLSYGSRKTNHRIRGNGLDWAKRIGLGSSELGNLRFTQW